MCFAWSNRGVWEIAAEKMREFMHYITNAFYGATDWNDDNTYKELNLIDFPLPRGLRLTLSSLATPHFATSYQLGSVGIVDGSISYLHSSVPLTGITARSDRIPLPALLRSYRRLHDLGSKDQQQYVGAEPAPTESTSPAVTSINERSGTNDNTLLYGRLYLPQSLLEGLVVRRFTPALQVQLSAVSERSLPNGGTLLGLVQYDKRKYGVEGLASTDGGLLGVRGLYNFGGDASSSALNPPVGTPSSENNGNGHSAEKERIYGRFSAGGELYYGTLNKSGGMSLGARFATLPAHRGTPLTATLTINPLMGNINATYAVLAREYCSLATKMEFNVYSYESEWAVGVELWSNRRPAGFLLGANPDDQAEPDPKPPRRGNERSFQAKMEWRLDDPEPEPTGPVADEKSADAGPKEEYRGVLKARFDQNLRFGLLWEGRVKSLIFSLGTGVDMRRLGEPFRSLGLEIQYSS
ncbi:mitochondrial distribution and morphology protein 10 [Chaetomium sp. MPI-CAGE-AT-0009]|nr:mitochondrial distribution and morphology protein 10 [Chaetomium sp. MPI-CAGE-AT-0009]